MYIYVCKYIYIHIALYTSRDIDMWNDVCVWTLSFKNTTLTLQNHGPPKTSKKNTQTTNFAPHFSGFPEFPWQSVRPPWVCNSQAKSPLDASSPRPGPISWRYPFLKKTHTVDSRCRGTLAKRKIRSNPSSSPFFEWNGKGGLMLVIKKECLFVFKTCPTNPKALL